jgi:2-keto-4-pentenoate hydratase/2-oxohepta-3-ene-1,7-dioic acid hydratase in catechol pathway
MKNFFLEIAGDIISTGTPSRTALSMTPHLKHLQHGDIVEVEVEGTEKIRNMVLTRLNIN